MKHLLYEHQNNLTELKAEGTVAMKLVQKDHRYQEMELRKDMRTLKVELKEQELANEMVVKNLRLVGPSASSVLHPLEQASLVSASAFGKAAFARPCH